MVNGKVSKLMRPIPHYKWPLGSDEKLASACGTGTGVAISHLNVLTATLADQEYDVGRASSGT